MFTFITLLITTIIIGYSESASAISTVTISAVDNPHGLNADIVNTVTEHRLAVIERFPIHVFYVFIENEMNPC